MRLPDLVRAAYPAEADRSHVPNTVVTSVTQDARQVRPGSIFVARKGARFDGHDFLPEVVAAGAVLVVGARDVVPVELLGGTPYLRVANDRVAVARLAAALHRWPSRKLRVIGVTGTDGKTTTSALAWWLLQATGPAALFSTAQARIGHAEAPLSGHFTTPEADVVQRFLADALEAGAGRVVLESSSHGLALHRLDEVAYDLAVWTNLTPEHLDFHGSFEAYREAKLSLVRRAPHTIVCRDDASFEDVARAAQALTTYGTHAEADWHLVETSPRPGGQEVRIRTPAGEECSAFLPLVGAYNALNALAAIAVATHEGVGLAQAVERLASFPGVRGRMQRIQTEPFQVLVDFAHTGPALAKALDAVKATAERVLLVIGAAGERDRGKRVPLAEAAIAGADLTIFTEEDARSEDPDAILADLARAATAAGGREGASFLVVPDRREAIREAIARATPGSLVLLAGKGHEATLERADVTLAWDEAAEARAALLQRVDGHDRSLE